MEETLKNKLGKMAPATRQQLVGATYREQLTAEGCKKLIANSSM